MECMSLRMTFLLYFNLDQNQVSVHMVMPCNLHGCKVKLAKLLLDPPAHPLMQSAAAKGTWSVHE